MATVEQFPQASGIGELNADRAANPLNQLLARAYTLDWQLIFYVVLFATAVLTRMVNLGDRVMSHDESLHTRFSFDLYKKGEFQHTPLMHGPVLFHAVAFFYFLFGDSDFTARLYPAILGIMLVMMPRFLFERWLGKRGAMVTSVLLLISPMVLFHNRYIREDTPAIFFTMIMVFALFQYLDGKVSGKVHWMVIFAGATLLNLASKETGFMYIAIFGGFMTLYWLVQVVQGLRSGETNPVVGVVIGGLIGLAILAGGALLIGGLFSDFLAGHNLTLPRVVIQTGVLILLILLAAAIFKPILIVLGAVGDRANSTLQTLTVGIILGSVAALIMIVILTIAKPSIAFAADDPNASTTLYHMVAWTVLTALVLLGVVLGTMFVGFTLRARRIPWGELLVILGVALIVCAVLVFVEERSANKGAAADIVKNNIYIAATWLICIAACIGLIGLRVATPFFEEMKRYPVFDALVVLGTLILPWLTALPLFLAGYQLDNYPVATETASAVLVTVIPFALVAIVGGLCWKPELWVACASVFYGLCAFFYTTVFTNPGGLISGVIGSLGYWLAQQGVRRGSQPQYYYLLVELPVYEYLPLIGALLAGVGALVLYWRFRADRYLDVAQATLLAHTAVLDEAAALAVEAGIIPAEGFMSTEVPPFDQTQIGHATVAFDVAATEDMPADDLNLTPAAEAFDEPDESGISSLPPLPDPIEKPRIFGGAERLERLPFFGFVAFWAVLIIYAFTISGEKMPWLTTHLTIPLILITGAFVGNLLDRVEWPQFFRAGWALLLLTPLLIIALLNVFGAFFVSNRPFAGLDRDQLLQTGVWFAALLVTLVVLYGIVSIFTRIGARQTLRIMLIGVFVLLGVATARTAWRFAYIDFDYATEFGVYAHGAPAMKTVMNKIQELSLQTTDGMGIKVAYDDDVSWPGSWYFRQYSNATFLGNTTSTTDLEAYSAIVVSLTHSTNLEAQLGDKFYKYNFIRLWWPMQDYFDLTPQRIDNVFALDNSADPSIKSGALRDGLWSIWWNRDYASYATATNKNLDISQWPVADRMVFYVRKDVAAQVWDMGVGGATASAALPADSFAKLNCPTCVATAAFGSNGPADGQFDHPRGLTFDASGNLVIADSKNARILTVSTSGAIINQFGSFGDADKAAAPGGTFKEPWDMAVGKDGMVYVADTWNHRVEVFDANHQFVRMWGHFEQTQGAQPGAVDGFWGPRAIVVDDLNRIYVADTGNKRVRVYANDGKFLYNIGTAGAGQGQLNEPVGLVIDQRAGHLFVADTWNHRIEVFDLSGNFVSSWSVPSWNGSNEDTGNRPYLALDPSGTRLFVTEPDVARVLVWDVSALNAQGGALPLVMFGAKGGSDLNHFDVLGGIAVDNSGNVFLADAGTGRILRFEIAKLPGAPVVVPPVIAPPIIATELATQAVSAPRGSF